MNYQRSGRHNSYTLYVPSVCLVLWITMLSHDVDIHMQLTWWQIIDPVGWGSRWIKDHQASGAVANKPVIMEEFGIQLFQSSTYKTWYDTIVSSGLAGDLIWYVPPLSRPNALRYSSCVQASGFSPPGWRHARRWLHCMWLLFTSDELMTLIHLV